MEYTKNRIFNQHEKGVDERISHRIYNVCISSLAMLDVNI